MDRKALSLVLVGSLLAVSPLSPVWGKSKKSSKKARRYTSLRKGFTIAIPQLRFRFKRWGE